MNLDEQLRRHDPARDVPDDLARSPRALATLARVTATDPAPMTTARPAHRRRALRYALAGVVAATGVVLAPILGTDDDAANATWDAQPHAATPAEAARAARDCADWTQVPLADYRPKVVEVRGDWVMTYLASADAEAQCLRSMTATAEFPEGEGQAMSGPLPQTPAADALATVGVMETSGGVTHTQFLVAGKVGAAVTGVTFEAQGLQVRATVTNGRFTAWWPKRKPDSVAGRIVDNTGWNGSPNPEVTITLTGGRTITRPVKDYDVNH